jgi:hypothetical protein
MSKPDEPSTTPDFYSLDEARGLVSELLSNPDPLTEEQKKLLVDYGPVFKPVVENGAQVGFVEVFEKPCPPHLLQQLDEALGRDATLTRRTVRLPPLYVRSFRAPRSTRPLPGIEPRPQPPRACRGRRESKHQPCFSRRWKAC